LRRSIQLTDSEILQRADQCLSQLPDEKNAFVGMGRYAILFCDPAASDAARAFYPTTTGDTDVMQLLSHELFCLGTPDSILPERRTDRDY